MAFLIKTSGRSVLACLLLAMWVPLAAYAEQAIVEQPIPFSHKVHVALQLGCTFCHTNPDPGNQMTLPSAERCMGCHAKVATDRMAIQQLARAAAQGGDPIRWKQLYSV